MRKMPLIVMCFVVSAICASGCGKNFAHSNLVDPDYVAPTTTTTPTTPTTTTTNNNVNVPVDVGFPGEVPVIIN